VEIDETEISCSKHIIKCKFFENCLI